VKHVLVLAPHVDDGEIGCGGSIVRLIEQNDIVSYVTFSTAKKSIPKGFSPDITEKEVRKATAILGVQNLSIHDFEVRDFPAHRQEILEILVELNKDFQPDIVFAPSQHDTHQDHKVISEEAFRSFKTSTIFGYEIPWNNNTFSTDAFIPLANHHVRKKVEAIKAYMSQKIRMYGGTEFVQNLAAVRGASIRTQYAEAFEVNRLIWK